MSQPSFSLTEPLDDRSPEEALVRALQRIYRARMTTTSGGNLSVRDDAGNVWITPSAEDKGRLGPADIVRISPTGEVIGRHRPSSEWPFHRAIMRARPDLRAVIHGHPSALVAFSMAGRVPDTSVVPEVRAVCGAVGWAAYGLPGSDELGATIGASFAAGHDVVLLQNHGVVVAGGSVRQAFDRFETLERIAQTLLRAEALGPGRGLPTGELKRARHRALPTARRLAAEPETSAATSCAISSTVPARSASSAARRARCRYGSAPRASSSPPSTKTAGAFAPTISCW